MAILTAEELTEFRQAAASRAPTVTWTKPEINAAAQALEDDFEAPTTGVRARLRGVITSAMGPSAPSTPTVDLFIALAAAQKARREGP